MYCPCQAISEDLNRYGRDSFEMKVLAEVPIQYGSEAEQAWYDDCSKWCEMYNSFRPNANTKLPHHEKEYEQHLDVAYRFLFPIHP